MHVECCDTIRSRKRSMSSNTGQLRNRRYIRVSQQRKTKLRWPENSIDHQKYTGGAAAAAVRIYTYVRIKARPISSNPGSIEEECKYGLTSGTCFTAHRLGVVAVAGRLWIYFVLCFFSVWWYFVFSFCRFLYFKRTRPTASMSPPLASLPLY